MIFHRLSDEGIKLRNSVKRMKAEIFRLKKRILFLLPLINKIESLLQSFEDSLKKIVGILRTLKRTLTIFPPGTPISAVVKGIQRTIGAIEKALKGLPQIMKSFKKFMAPVAEALKKANEKLLPVENGLDSVIEMLNNSIAMANILKPNQADLERLAKQDKVVADILAVLKKVADSTVTMRTQIDNASKELLAVRKAIDKSVEDTNTALKCINPLTKAFKKIKGAVDEIIAALEPLKAINKRFKKGAKMLNIEANRQIRKMKRSRNALVKNLGKLLETSKKAVEKTAKFIDEVIDRALDAAGLKKFLKDQIESFPELDEALKALKQYNKQLLKLRRKIELDLRRTVLKSLKEILKIYNAHKKAFEQMAKLPVPKKNLESDIRDIIDQFKDTVSELEKWVKEEEKKIKEIEKKVKDLEKQAEKEAAKPATTPDEKRERRRKDKLLREWEDKLRRHKNNPKKYPFPSHPWGPETDPNRGLAMRVAKLWLEPTKENIAYQYLIYLQMQTKAFSRKITKDESRDDFVDSEIIIYHEFSNALLETQDSFKHLDTLLRSLEYGPVFPNSVNVKSRKASLLKAKISLNNIKHFVASNDKAYRNLFGSNPTTFSNEYFESLAEVASRKLPTLPNQVYKALEEQTNSRR